MAAALAGPLAQHRPGSDFADVGRIHMAITFTVSEQVAQQVDLTVWPDVLPECLDHHRAGISANLCEPLF